MSNKPGDQSKKPPECKALGKFPYKCQNLKEIGSDFEGEQYKCEICGQQIYLDYEEMK